MSKSTLPVNIAEQIQKDLAAIKQSVEAPGVERIKATPKGFQLPDGSRSSTIRCVILDFVAHNVHYPGAYNADNPVPPDCSATSRVMNAMTPDDRHRNEETGEFPYGDNCTSCPKNQWESAAVGKGKACKNTRRLIIMQEGGDMDAPVWELSVSPSSVGKFDQYVGSTLARKHQLIPQAVLTEISLDENVDWAAPRFNVVRPLEEDELIVSMGRREEAKGLLTPNASA